MLTEERASKWWWNYKILTTTSPIRSVLVREPTVSKFVHVYVCTLVINNRFTDLMKFPKWFFMNWLNPTTAANE